MSISQADAIRYYKLLDKLEQEQKEKKDNILYCLRMHKKAQNGNCWYLASANAINVYVEDISFRHRANRLITHLIVKGSRQ